METRAPWTEPALRRRTGAHVVPRFPAAHDARFRLERLTDCIMKIGIVGYQGSGKSTLFHWLTGVRADPALAHVSQSAMAPIPDERIEPLCGIYHPKKVTQAALEIVDTPGLARTHEGNAARLALIREAGCLLLTVAAFGGADPIVDLRTFEEDLLLA